MKALLFALCCGLSGFAHDSYLMPAKSVVTPGTPLLVSIHNGDSFPASEHPTDPARIAEARTSEGSPIADLQMTGRATHGFIKVKGSGSLYVTMRLHPRVLTLTPAKFEAYLREEGLANVIEARQKAGQSGASGRELYAKFAKAYMVSGAPNQAFSNPVGHEIEFVPESDPSSVRIGSALPVQVLFRGKPLRDAQVQRASLAGSVVVGRTDAAGRIQIPIERDGKYRLHVVHMEPSRDKSVADWESFWASLTFAVPPPVVTQR